MYKEKFGNVYKIAQIFHASPTTISTWVKDMIPIAQTPEEKQIENVLVKNTIPYNKIRLQGYSHICVPDFVISPENPKVIIEVKKNGRRHHQQWHRLCNLLSKEMSFCSTDLKRAYTNLLTIAIINKKWNISSMKTQLKFR